MTPHELALLEIRRQRAAELATEMALMLAMSTAPRVEACIAAVMDRYPSDQSTVYYVAVHQSLAPLARELEAENVRLQAEVERLRPGSVAP